MKRIIAGEFIGTFVLVLIGCSTVALAVLYSLPLLSVALLWGLAVFAGIMISSSRSDSHLNPAVTFGFLASGKIRKRELGPYLLGQFAGAFIAGFTVYLIFSGDILQFEQLHGIVQGNENSKSTAMIFGEFYPNPGNKELIELSSFRAFMLEGLGTFALMSSILIISGQKKIKKVIAALLIGATVSILIIGIAPYTQAGLNPARDFGPRLSSYFTGWKSVVFQLPAYGFITVYIIAPIAGACLSAVTFRLLTPNKNNLTEFN